LQTWTLWARPCTAIISCTIIVWGLRPLVRVKLLCCRHEPCERVLLNHHPQTTHAQQRRWAAPQVSFARNATLPALHAYTVRLLSFACEFTHTRCRECFTAYVAFVPAKKNKVDVVMRSVLWCASAWSAQQRRLQNEPLQVVLCT